MGGGVAKGGAQEPGWWEGSIRFKSGRAASICAGAAKLVVSSSNALVATSSIEVNRRKKKTNAQCLFIAQKRYLRDASIIQKTTMRSINL